MPDMQHHVITGRSGQHLGLHLFGRGVKVVDRADAGFGLEIGEGRLADVVGPVVDVDRAARAPRTGGHRAWPVRRQGR